MANSKKVIKIARLSKVNVARQLVDEAIMMFFIEANPIAIHVVVGAAHQILTDLTGKSALKNDAAATKSGMGKDWYKEVNKEYNFFKHADKDKDEKLVFDPTRLTVYLVDCVLMYRKLTGASPYSHRVFEFWFCLARPNSIGDERTREIALEIGEKIISPADYGEFLKMIIKKADKPKESNTI